jgi:hypothetical protein
MFKVKYIYKGKITWRTYNDSAERVRAIAEAMAKKGYQWTQIIKEW